MSDPGSAGEVPPVDRDELLADLLHYSRQLAAEGLVIGPGGNTSCRVGDYMYVKPSGLGFAEMRASDWVEVHLPTGAVTPGPRRPSSEVAMHRLVYLHRDVRCVFHAHPPYTIGIAARGLAFQHVFPDSVVYLGATIPVIAYTTPCTETLADRVRAGLGADGLVVVLKNHGALTVGDSPKTAFLRMQLLEGLAHVLWIAHALPGPEPVAVLGPAEVATILNLESEQYRQRVLEE